MNDDINNVYIFIFFNTVCVIPVYGVLFILMIPVGDMSMVLADVCDKVAGDKVFALKTYFHEVFWLKVNVNDKVS